MSSQLSRRAYLSTVKPFKLVVLEKCIDFYFEVVSIMMNYSCLQVFQSVQIGWKTSYYQKTYDFKGEEEEVQPSGLSAVKEEDEGEDVELPPELVNTPIEGDDCDACTI